VACPNDCSGHGVCRSMEDINVDFNKHIFSGNNYTYGTGKGISTIAWDYRSMYGCVCDSSWAVGFNAGERQLSEYFGADCSLRKFFFFFFECIIKLLMLSYRLVYYDYYYY
jgi:hypothetical protein